jgi:hypothetical protein
MATGPEKQNLQQIQPELLDALFRYYYENGLEGPRDPKTGLDWKEAYDRNLLDLPDRPKPKTEAVSTGAGAPQRIYDAPDEMVLALQRLTMMGIIEFEGKEGKWWEVVGNNGARIVILPQLASFGPIGSDAFLYSIEQHFSVVKAREFTEEIGQAVEPDINPVQEINSALSTSSPQFFKSIGRPKAGPDILSCFRELLDAGALDPVLAVTVRKVEHLFKQRFPNKDVPSQTTIGKHIREPHRASKVDPPQ